MAGWHGVEMRHLAALEAVAAERSFSAAAARLGYTQSAISGQILSLERVVGTRVFERVRGARPLCLTEAGRVLLEHASAISARLDAAQAELGALAAGGDRVVRVGIQPTVSPALVPGALAALARGGAPVQVDLRHAVASAPLVEQLESGRLDVAVVVAPIASRRLEQNEVYRDDYVVVVPAADVLARKGAATVAELGGRQVMTLDDGRPQSVLTAVGASTQAVRRLEDPAALLAFVAAGLGVGCLPSLTAELPPGLTAVPIATPLPQHVVVVVSNGELPLDERGQRFVAAVVNAGRKLTHPPALVRAS